MDIPIKRFDTNFPLPSSDVGAACFDLVCRETVIFEPHRITSIAQNIAVKVPEGYALLLFNRSSTPLRMRLMLANGVGVVDSFYCGDKDEVLAFLLNVTDEAVTVNAGDKIVQGMIVKTEPITWDELDSMPEKGHGGYKID
jgi:dUTP pyrophosphatase